MINLCFLNSLILTIIDKSFRRQYHPILPFGAKKIPFIQRPKTYGTEIYDDVTWLDTNFDAANRKIALISAIDKESH